MYAIANNSSRAGHTLQNRSPIPLGTDYTELLVTGWIARRRCAAAGLRARSRCVLPWCGSAPHQITPSGGYLDASVLGGVRGALLLPHSNASAATTLRVSTIPGLPSGVPGPRAGTDAGPPPVVVETIRFAFSRRRPCTLSAYPTFKFAFPGASQDSRSGGCYLELCTTAGRARTLGNRPWICLRQARVLERLQCAVQSGSRSPVLRRTRLTRFPEAIEFGAANISAPIPPAAERRRDLPDHFRSCLRVSSVTLFTSTCLPRRCIAADRLAVAERA